MDRIPRLKLPSEIIKAIDQTSREIRALDVSEFVKKELYRPSSHLLKHQGKMLRPALVFMGADYCGHKEMGQFVDLAMSMELLHISSLIYDDIIDRDLKRRGVDAVHVKYGNEKAMLAGNALIAKSIEKSAAYGTEVIRQTADAAMKMCAGETLDHAFQSQRLVPNLKQYLEIAELKSASLISASSGVAAHYKGSKHAGSLMEFGQMFGLGFQIRDDVFDFIEEDRATRFSPNVVSSIRSRGVNEKEAIKSAVELNNSYIDKALNYLDLADGGDIFSRYSELVRLDYDEVVR